MKKEFINNLDNVLRYLNENRRIECFTNKEIIDSCLSGQNVFECTDVMSQLKEDKYVFNHHHGDNDWRVNITHKGRLFIEKGGYAQELINLQAEQNRKARNSNILLGASLIGGCYYLTQILKFVYGLFCGC
ncbi:MAG TPA: hypothetical protein PLN38_15775 [Chitinophagales bacterium]|nr:hypothetical protein [Chitinophagales bacterium]